MLHFVDKFWSATCRWLLFNEFTLRRQSLALVFAIRRVLHACEIELPADVENTRPLRLCQSPICHGTNQGSFYSVWYLSRSGNVTHYVIERLGQGNESAFFCKFLSCLQADVEAVFYPHAATRPDGWLWPLCLPSVIKNLRIHVTIVRLRCFLTCTGVDLTPMVQVSNYR